MSAGGQAKVYKIQQGDTFSSIAARTYGDRNLYRIIVAANPKVDPSHLKIGTEIVVPDSSTIHPASSPEARTAVGTIGNRAEAKLDSKTEYRVASGDSLHRISTRLYGNINMVDKLYELNKNAIGADPAKLKLGMVLKLPAAAHAQVN